MEQSKPSTDGMSVADKIALMQDAEKIPVVPQIVQPVGQTPVVTPATPAAAIGKKQVEPQVGDIVFLNLTHGVRPAMLLVIYEGGLADMTVFFNGSQDYILTGGDKATVWYSKVQRGSGEGQWQPRPSK